MADRLHRQLADAVAQPQAASAATALTPAANDANFCFGPSYTDTQGDGGAFLDIQAYGLVFDCSANTWFFGAQTFDHWTSSRLDHLFLDFDTDGNLSNHCFGMDYEVVAFWTGTALAADLYPLSAPDASGACTPATQPVAVPVTRGTTLDEVGVAFVPAQIGNATMLQWFSWLGDSVENTDPSTGDFAPDALLARADASASTGCSPSAAAADGSLVSGADAQLVASTLRDAGDADARVTAAGQVTFHGDGAQARRVLAAKHLAVSVSPNYLRRESKAAPPPGALPAVLGTPPDDYNATTQWNLAAVKADLAWAVTHGSATVKVADLDSGVDFTQPDLAGKLLPGFDVTTGVAVAMTSGMQDQDGHGTATAGVMAAATNNTKGLASLGYDTKVLPIRLVDDASGFFTDSAIAAGLHVAADQGAKILNASFGSQCNDPALASAVAYAQGKGVLIVSSAGNEDVDGVGNKVNPVDYPSAYPGVMSVAATGHSGTHAFYSNEGDDVRIAAPGGDADGIAADGIALLCPVSGPGGPGGANPGNSCAAHPDGVPTTRESGTSFSSPTVAAAAALVLAVNPSLTAADAAGLLESTAVDIGAPGYDITYGAGLLDAAHAVTAAGSATRGTYHALTPSRLLDSRDGSAPGFRLGPLASAETYGARVTGVGGVPAVGVSAVVVNATVTGPTGVGFLSLFPTGPLPSPPTANLTYGPGQTIANLTTVKVGIDGEVAVYAFGPSAVDVILDVVGWYDDGSSPAAGDSFAPTVNPQRVLDTRDPSNAQGNATPVTAAATRNVTVTGVGGVPASGVDAVVVNVTVTDTTANSFLTVWPGGQPRPLAASVNWPPGGFISNQVIAKVGAGGQISVYNNLGQVDLVLDVAGWFTTAATGQRLTALAPSRILDTRNGTGADHFTTALGPGQSRAVSVAGQGGVPAVGAQAVVLNVAVTPRPALSSAVSFLTAWPSDQSRPLAASLLWPAGATIASLVTVKLGADGKVDVFNNLGNVDVIFDVFAYY
jgi:subtilisin family serine protease